MNEAVIQYSMHSTVDSVIFVSPLFCKFRVLPSTCKNNGLHNYLNIYCNEILDVTFVKLNDCNHQTYSTR